MIAAARGVQSIRVDLDKVDRVVNMVGELVITQSMLTQQMDDTLRGPLPGAGARARSAGADDARPAGRGDGDPRATGQIGVLAHAAPGARAGAEDRQEDPARDRSAKRTEIDKTVIEQLSDPLTHMIRNSADHGIETPEKRRAAGQARDRARSGFLPSRPAAISSSSVEDDGAGINRERVLEVARAAKLVIGPDQQLTEEQIDNLIFAPGFSTAEAVSDISGRGVGMDVVLSNIKKIGGSVHVRSRTGQGTRMTLRLPLTLAVLDVMLVKVGAAPYVVPLSLDR